MKALTSAANRAWLMLVAATGITYWLGESGIAEAGGRIVLVMFGLALIKGWLVIFDFMELRHAPRKWQVALCGWLLFVTGIILLAYWLGRR